MMFECGLIIWGLGVGGVLVKRGNVLEVLLSVEVMLSGIIISFIFASLEMDDVGGLVMGLMVLVVAAAESCVGLGVLVSYYGLSGTIVSKRLRLVRQ